MINRITMVSARTPNIRWQNTLAWDVRYNERSAAEPVNGSLKDDFGGRYVRVRGLGMRVAGLAPAPRLGRNRFLVTRHVAGMRVDDRHVTEGEALALISGASWALSIRL